MRARGSASLTYGLAFVLAAGCSAQLIPEPTAGPTQRAMGTMAGGPGSAEYAPLVKGFYDEGEILFIHTEASDRSVAQMLTRMMGPEVVLVPQLADVPDSSLAEVYVFTNGVAGEGPFGFQPDVFDSVPGDAAYRPLRRLNLVHWAVGADPRTLRSVAEIRSADLDGEVSIEIPGAVVNMPVLVWPGGHR